MRPISSSYDRGMAAADAEMRALVNVDTLTVGDTIEYETAESIADPAWRTLEREIERRGLRLEDDGSGWRVRGAIDER